MKTIKSGYTPCACPDCFDVAVSSNEQVPAMCPLCAQAGCAGKGCLVPDELEVSRE